MKEVIVYVIVAGMARLILDWNNPNYFDDNMILILCLAGLTLIFDKVEN